MSHLQLDLRTFHLVGCCVGGGVALLYARRHPERVRSVSVISVATPKTVASAATRAFTPDTAEPIPAGVGYPAP